MDASINVEHLLDRIISYKDANQQMHIDRFNKEWLASTIEEKGQIEVIERRFRDFDPRGVDIVDFVRMFLNILDHNESETLYIVMGLIELFRDICETFSLAGYVKAADVLNYVVDV